MFKRLLWFLLLQLIVVKVGSCQLSYDVQHYTDENGLPQNSVKSIASDKNGFIWLATEDGIVRFDGRHFKRFAKDNLELSDNHFQSIYPGADSNSLYACNGHFEEVRISNGQVIRSDSIQPFLLAKAKYAPTNSYIWYVDGLESMYKNLQAGVDKAYIPDIPNGLYEYDGKKIGYLFKNRLQYEISYKAPGDWHFFLINHRLYMPGPGLNFISFVDKALQRSFEGDILLDNPDGPIIPLWNISSPNYTILYWNQSFYLATETEPGKLHTKRLFTGFDAVRNNICSAWYSEKTGKLYLGSTTLGFFVLSPHSFLTLAPADREHVFYSQAIYKESKIITPQGVIFDLSGIPHVDGIIDPFVPDDFYSIFVDHNRFVWTNWHNKIYKFDSSDFKLQKEWEMPSPVSIIYQGWDTSLWVGLRSGGLYRMQKDKNVEPLFFAAGVATINFIQQINKDQLFYGTDKGAFLATISSGKVVTIPGLMGKEIRNVYVASPDELWVTTYGEGFFLLQGNRLIKFPLDPDHFLSVAHTIIPDKQGFFWIPTNRGLFQVKKQDLVNYTKDTTLNVYYYYHDRTEGFFTNEFNGGSQPASLSLNNGYISLPSMNGIVIFKPEEVSYILPKNKIYIDKIVIDGREINRNDLLSLPHNSGQLSIEISCPYEGHKRNLRLSYGFKVDDKVEDWVTIPEDGIIRFFRLPVGAHQLVIRKVNGFGKENFEIFELNLFVVPPWYQKGWFYFLAGLLVLMGIVLFVKMRLNYAERRTKILEAAVTYKTKELSQQANVQKKIIQSVSHDVQTPLHYHKVLTERLYSILKVNAGDAEMGIANALKESAYRLDMMVANLVGYLKVQVNSSDATTQKIRLKELVEEKCALFQKIALEKSTIITNRISEEQELVTDPSLLSIIIHNLIDNAVKVTRNGTVSIFAKPFEHHLEITIADTGPGMGDDLIEWLNNPDSTAGNVSVRGHGLGLMMVKELADNLNIKIRVNSSKEAGTSFNLMIPKAN